MAIFLRNDKYLTDQGCYIMKSTRGINTSSHTHDFLEIVYAFSGNSLHVVDGIQYNVSTGDLLFVDIGCTHSFTCNKCFSYVNIILKPEFISGELKGTDNAFSLLELEDFKDLRQIVDTNNRLCHFDPLESKFFESYINLALSEQETDNAGKELMLRSVFNSLLIFAFRKMALPMKMQSRIDTGLLDFIKANCTKRLSLYKFAADCHYSPAHFCRLFKKQTGQTFTEYVTSCRLERAAELLADTEISVEDVCVEAGFTNRTKFFKDFGKKFGCSPLKYKKSKSNTF